jgi:hypothetical protein
VKHLLSVVNGQRTNDVMVAGSVPRSSLLVPSAVSLEPKGTRNQQPATSNGAVVGTAMARFPLPVARTVSLEPKGPSNQQPATSNRTGGAQ